MYKNVIYLFIYLFIFAPILFDSFANESINEFIPLIDGLNGLDIPELNLVGVSKYKSS